MKLFRRLLSSLGRVSPVLTSTGAIAIVVGLAWDARLHAADPSLSAHESVFSIDNPAHALMLAGIALAVAGASGYLIDRVLMSSAAWRRLVAGIAIAGLALGSFGSARAAIAAATTPVATTPSSMGSTSAPALAAMSGGSAMVTVTSGAGCGDNPPTAVEATAATALVQAVKVRSEPLATLSAAETAGYRQATPWAFGGWGRAHFNHPSPLGAHGTLDPTNPPNLVFFRFPDGHTALMGAMFTDSSGDASCPGGVATRWHVHPNLCWNGAANRTAVASTAGCPSGTVSLAHLEMLHVWIFSGPSGPFAADLTKADYQAAMAQLN
jgi:hypothetical protein